MPVNKDMYQSLRQELGETVTLVAVSKTKPIGDILELYQLGQRDFGENYVQELLEKAPRLPADIRWHFIGHLQTNKVKLIIPVVQLIHGVDSLKLLKEINKEAGKAGKQMDVLLQLHIAREASKFGLDEAELSAILEQVKTGAYEHVRVRGLMGMASFTDHAEEVRQEFRQLRTMFQQGRNLLPEPGVFEILSMGMSGDFRIAVEEGSTLVRIGSLLFGERARK